MAALAYSRFAAAERAVVLSPLLNLAPGAATGPKMVHRCPLVSLGAAALTGFATLSLSPDRRTVDIAVELDPPRHALVRLRRLDLDAGEDLLVAEILASPSPTLPGPLSLDDRHAVPTFADTEALLATGLSLATLRACAVDGVHVDPPRPRAPAWLADRMLVEIAAAEASASAAAASRHVALAVLYARRLGASAGAPAP